MMADEGKGCGVDNEVGGVDNEVGVGDLVFVSSSLDETDPSSSEALGSLLFIDPRGEPELFGVVSESYPDSSDLDPSGRPRSAIDTLRLLS